MQENEGKIVYINQGSESEKIFVEKDEAVLILGGKVIQLDSFILCGDEKTNEGKSRVVLTWNNSLDEMLIYKGTLNIAVDEKVRKSLEGNK